ncbi:MAG: hypothetical protein IPQ07_44825 [Myxococcales bacterium]|nr:hypothetical protein [Myxococcales bacterium]
MPDPTSSDVELDALVMNLKDIAKRVVKLMPELPKEAGALVDSVTEAGHLADLITSHLSLGGMPAREAGRPRDVRPRQDSVRARSCRCSCPAKARGVSRSARADQHPGAGGAGRNQREYVLRQWLKAIKEEVRSSMTAAVTRGRVRREDH